jgi:hypothetical protein
VSQYHQTTLSVVADVKAIYLNAMEPSSICTMTHFYC